MPADQLHQAGLINRLVPAGEALDAARELAAQISQNAPLALAATKRVIVESAGLACQRSLRPSGLDRGARLRLGRRHGGGTGVR